jgi:hypothetical protein
MKRKRWCVWVRYKGFEGWSEWFCPGIFNSIPKSYTAHAMAVEFSNKWKLKDGRTPSWIVVKVLPEGKKPKRRPSEIA